ncbi:MAG: hypothetical protein JXL20_09130 [Deltaproteobacteria bacterium]|nr:hypothetical protein [Deltaproteobacteria bacterium]
MTTHLPVPGHACAEPPQFMGLLPGTVWLELIAAVGFEPLVVFFEHISYSDTGHEVFLVLRSVANEGA